MSRFSMVMSICLLMLSIIFFIDAHDGMHSFSPFSAEADFLMGDTKTSDRLTSWLNEIGRFHLLMVHFPIALITMTVVAECLWIWFKNPIFDHAARFMILSAAIFAVPTALLGLAFGYGQNFEGLSLELYVWHRYFGLLTVGLVIIAAILRERYVRQMASSLISYYICLFILFICVSLTGAFGGGLAFGLDVW